MKKYDGISISIIGSAHIKNNIECQDFSSNYSNNEYSVAVVCDGHGSSKHFRSAKGAEIAANVAIKAIRELFKSEKDFDKNKENLLIQLEKNIILNWNSFVNEHLSQNPFSAEELNILSDKDRKSVESNIESAYGSTLIAFVLSDKFSLGIQIGDGDCLAIDECGNCFNPLPKDERLQFNITTSLCDKYAIRNFRHFWSEKTFAGCVISTDGVSNSFANIDFYNSFCLTILDDLNETSSTEALHELSVFLQKLTQNGSGDDVSISAVYNKELLNTVLKNKSEKDKDLLISNPVVSRKDEYDCEMTSETDAEIVAEDVVNGLTCSSE